MKQGVVRAVFVGAMVIAMVMGLSSIAAGEVITKEGLATLLAPYWTGTPAVNAFTTAMVESNGGDTQAINHETGDYGLWQINLALHPDCSMADALDPVKATAYAFKLYGWAGNRFTDWAAYNKKDLYGRNDNGEWYGEPHGEGGTKQWWVPWREKACSVIVVDDYDVYESDGTPKIPISPEPSGTLALGCGLVGLGGVFFRCRRR